jgi:hypothetical protein
MRIFIIAVLMSSNVLIFGQQISGTVFEKNSDMPVEYVNIGIVGKNVGTVSDRNGKYTLQINPEYKNDTLRFSSIGYHSYSVKVSDFINLNNGNVRLEKRLYDLTEVIVRPKKVKQKTLGITIKGGNVSVCSDSIYGSEVGILMKNKNNAFLKEVNINVRYCSYDTVFYRLNVYKAGNNMQFETVLSNPVYFSLPKKDVANKITVDLRYLNLVINGDFLVTFEVVKHLGPGRICFPASLLHKSYFRKTSQGAWDTLVAGISLSVEVDVEK